MTRTKILSILGAVVTIGTIAGGVFFFEDRYAKCSTVDLLAMRLDQKIIQDRVKEISLEMERIQDLHSTDDPLEMPVNTRNRYRRLQQERNYLEMKIRELYKESKHGE